LLLILFECGAGLLDLFLRSGVGLLNGLSTQLIGLLLASFLELENLLAGFAKALLVVGGAGFGGGNISARFLHGSLSAVPAFGENEQGVKAVKHRH
jgi:hypothetical protein